MSAYDPNLDPYAVALSAGYKYLGVIDDHHVAEECGPGDGRLECFGLDELFDALDTIRLEEFQRGRAQAIAHTREVASLARDTGHDDAADRLEAKADLMAAEFRGDKVESTTPFVKDSFGDVSRTRLTVGEWAGDVMVSVAYQRAQILEGGRRSDPPWITKSMVLGHDEIPQVVAAMLAMSAGFGYADYRGEHALIDLDTHHVITTFSTVSQLAAWCEGRKAER